MRVRVRACVRACVRVRVRVCARVSLPAHCNKGLSSVHGLPIPLGTTSRLSIPSGSLTICAFWNEERSTECLGGRSSAFVSPRDCVVEHAYVERGQRQRGPTSRWVHKRALAGARERVRASEFEGKCVNASEFEAKHELSYTLSGNVCA
eukprot:1916133-Pleurochrysis_carterae.AAC.1